MKTAPALYAVLWLALASCSPKDTIPFASTHPANPAAPTGQRPASITAEASPPAEPANDPHAGHGGGQDGAPVAPPAQPTPAKPVDPHTGHGGGGDKAAPPAKPADPHAGHGAAAPAKPGAVTSADKQAAAAAEQAAYQRAKPIFEKHCGGCHSASAKQTKNKKKTLGHFSIDTYPFGGHHASEAGQQIRVVLGVTGKKPTMPMDDPGAVQGAELQTVVEWSKAFDAAHAAGVHEAGADKGSGHGGH